MALPICYSCARKNYASALRFATLRETTMLISYKNKSGKLTNTWLNTSGGVMMADNIKAAISPLTAQAASGLKVGLIGLSDYRITMRS